MTFTVTESSIARKGTAIGAGAPYSGTALITPDTSGQACLRSTDYGDTYSNTGTLSLTTGVAVVYGNGTYLIVGGSARAYSTDEGANFTVVSYDGKSLANAVYGDKFVAVETGGYVWYSANGISWTSAGRRGTGVKTASLIWNGSFYMVHDSNTATVYKSTDGITWTSHASTSGFTGCDTIAWNGTKFVALPAHSGTLLSYSSTDGIEWTSTSIPVGRVWAGLVWNGTRFLAVGGSKSYLYSLDGTSWTHATFSTMYGTGTAVCGGNIVIIGTNISNSPMRALASGDPHPSPPPPTDGDLVATIEPTFSGLGSTEVIGGMFVPISVAFNATGLVHTSGEMAVTIYPTLSSSGYVFASGEMEINIEPVFFAQGGGLVAGSMVVSITPTFSASADHFPPIIIEPVFSAVGTIGNSGVANMVASMVADLRAFAGVTGAVDAVMQPSMSALGLTLPPAGEMDVLIVPVVSIAGSTFLLCSGEIAAVIEAAMDAHGDVPQVISGVLNVAIQAEFSARAAVDAQWVPSGFSLLKTKSVAVLV